MFNSVVAVLRFEYVLPVCWFGLGSVVCFVIAFILLFGCCICAVCLGTLHLTFGSCVSLFRLLVG